MSAIEDLEARARELPVEDGRRVQALGACDDARDAMRRYERAISSAEWALTVEVEPEQLRGGWAIQPG
jgi:hypothetical protein